MDATITADADPDYGAILADDIAYHMGERDSYDLESIEAATTGVAAPDDIFVSFQIGRKEFFSGDLYKQRGQFGSAGISFTGGEVIGKLRRQTNAINRDFAELDPEIAYAFDLRDARQHDYAKVFGTRKPIPVYQYHRRRGMHALIVPLPGFHQYPSRRMPKFNDTKTLQEKRARIFWRGKLTGHCQLPQGGVSAIRLAGNTKIGDDEKLAAARQLMRFRICEANIDNDAVDMRFVHPPGSSENMEHAQSLKRFFERRASIVEHLEYRYLLALDGYDGPSSWYWMINSNSIVMRQDSPWEMFGDNYFKPWIHFVPILQDGSDLMEKFNWCERNLAKCSRIVASTRHAASVLFESNYQRQRRHAVLNTYRQWMRR
jgi:hypothetical protein